MWFCQTILLCKWDLHSSSQMCNFLSLLTTVSDYSEAHHQSVGKWSPVIRDRGGETKQHLTFGLSFIIPTCTLLQWLVIKSGKQSKPWLQSVKMSTDKFVQYIPHYTIVYSSPTVLLSEKSSWKENFYLIIGNRPIFLFVKEIFCLCSLSSRSFLKL